MPVEAKPLWSGPKATPDEIRTLQRRLNQFTDHYLKGVGPILVDGVKGASTKKRITMVKYYLGYEKKSPVVTADFMKRLQHPRSARHSNTADLARAVRRRKKQHKVARKSSASQAGVAKFDDKPVASWLAPHLDWARRHGWTGTVISGYRTPEHSEAVCREKCGSPTCPGTCAGRGSNHSGKVQPSGALDVTEHEQFAELMTTCPHSPRILNLLGSKDPNHFSASGR